METGVPVDVPWSMSEDGMFHVWRNVCHFVVLCLMNVVFLFWTRHYMLLQCCFFEIRSKAWEKTVPMLVLGCLSSLGFCSQNLACSFTVRGCRREGQQDGDWSACGCSLVDVRGWYVSRLEECHSVALCLMNVVLLFWTRHQMLLQCCFFEIRSKAWEKTVPMLVLGCLSSLGFCSQTLACSFTVRGCRRDRQQDGDWSARGCSLVDVCDGMFYVGWLSFSSVCVGWMSIL